MQMHEGVVHLHLASDGKAMIGQYYTDARRSNCGDLQLRFHSPGRSTHAQMMALLEEPVPARDTR